MRTAQQLKMKDKETSAPDSFIEETAEAAYLVHPPEDDEAEANDNFPAHEILQGCIWRDAESSQQKVGLLEESSLGDREEDVSRRGELDFSDARHGARGFLDEETGMDAGETGL